MTPPVAVETLFAHTAAPPSADLVTVAVSLHNYARFLPECLDSVAAQRHAALDLVVVDDASAQDESADVALGWLKANAGRFAGVTLLRHRRNQGLAQTRNTAFEMARGELVFVLDADNTLYPRAIARLREALDDEGFDAAYTQLEFFGAQPRLGYADVWQAEHFAQANYVDAMALVRKRAWQAVGGYTHLDGGWEDYDFWCKFIEHGLCGAYLPEILCRYRVHEHSMLRTEHRQHHEGLAVQIMLRHPWLTLRGMSGREMSGRGPGGGAE
jgi:glycosyltransferase involved in cell wall biosynthesis